MKTEALFNKIRQLNHSGKLIFTFAALILAAVTMLSATYAWISISRTPIVSDLGLTVVSENKMELALDVNGRPSDEWDAVLDLSSVLNDVVPLKTVTYSQSQNRFLAAQYGLDGRMSGSFEPLTDAVNASVKGDSANGYYIGVTFWARASSNAVIGLSEAKEVDEGRAGTGTYVVGNPVWNGAAVVHENGGNGLETALRLGFRCQTTDLEGNPTEPERFVIYEPNADTHADGSTGYVPTASIDGTGDLIAGQNLIRQTTSTWNETTPVLSSDVVYSLGTFEDPTRLFEISNDTLQKITLYVWLEGQDIDCYNAVAANETSILANVQFTMLEEPGGTGIVRD